MPGLTAPSDYAEEPPRHPDLRINSKEPFNAEPHRSALVSSYITPVDFFYKRNHGPIPKIDDISRYSVSINGLVNKHIQLSMADIRLLPKYNVTATLQCAGNKRTAMSKVRKVRGVGWDVSALGNATWGGAKLSDVLELVGIPKLSSVTALGGKHVEFVSVDRCKEEKGGPYKASIPLKQATDPDADVLLAYEMNGEIINRDHGYPLRVVVPGVIGARSVKWLDSISVIKEECQGFFMQKDYKMFPPTVDWDNIDWSTRRPQMDFPVQSAICTLEDVDVIKEGKARIAGYAVSGGGRGIERVDISVDGGKTWVEAHRYQKSNVPYISDGAQSDKWAWVLFEATLDVPANAEIVAKAVDSAANIQPEKVEDIWNLRGILNTSWHRIKIQNSIEAAGKMMIHTDELEDTAWITVKFGSENPSADDWIAVFSPADFISGSCPNPSRYPGEPLLCTAPIKYQYANYSANYMDWGKGTIRFQLINQRADFSFALFTGGLENPRLVAVSKQVAFKNPKAPVFPRLAQGKTHDEMTVTWTSGYDISEAYPFVEWGVVTSSIGKSPTRTPAGTLTFNRGSMCGEPARTVGWRDPGFIHTAFMRDLWPNKEYFYKIGHELLDGTVVWGKSYTFKAPPTPGQNSLQRIIVFGDMGKAERDGSNEFSNYQPGSLNTTDTLIEDLDNYDIVFHIGDMPYANGYLSQWDQFTAQVAPISAKKPYMIASGNHERDWPNTGGFFDVKDSGGECGVPAETMYYYPAENRANFWYKVDYGLFRFCVADSEHDWREGTRQYKFIEECLSTVDRKHQPWLIFAAHRVLGYSSNSWYADQGSFEEPEGRESLQRLWQRYRVDIAFFGHVHNYERTCPLYQSQCVTGERSRYSGTMNGTIFVVAGGGGSHLSDYTTAIPKWSVFRDQDYGFTKLTAFNHSSLLFEYKKSSDGKVYDSFTIHRDYRDVLSCVHDSCFPTTLAT